MLLLYVAPGCSVLRDSSDVPTYIPGTVCTCQVPVPGYSIPIYYDILRSINTNSKITGVPQALARVLLVILNKAVRLPAVVAIFRFLVHTWYLVPDTRYILLILVPCKGRQSSRTNHFGFWYSGTRDFCHFSFVLVGLATTQSCY